MITCVSIFIAICCFYFFFQLTDMALLWSFFVAVVDIVERKSGKILCNKSLTRELQLKKAFAFTLLMAEISNRKRVSFNTEWGNLEKIFFLSKERTHKV